MVIAAVTVDVSDPQRGAYIIARVSSTEAASSPRPAYPGQTGRLSSLAQQHRRSLTPQTDGKF